MHYKPPTEPDRDRQPKKAILQGYPIKPFDADEEKNMPQPGASATRPLRNVPRTHEARGARPTQLAATPIRTSSPLCKNSPPHPAPLMSATSCRVNRATEIVRSVNRMSNGSFKSEKAPATGPESGEAPSPRLGAMRSTLGTLRCPLSARDLMTSRHRIAQPSAKAPGVLPPGVSRILARALRLSPERDCGAAIRRARW